MADALAVVKVGNSEWPLRRCTPWRASCGHVGRGRVVDHGAAQPVGDEQDDIVRLIGGLGSGEGRYPRSNPATSDLRILAPPYSRDLRA